MPAFGLNRFTKAYAVAVNDAGTRINDKPISCVDWLAADLFNWNNRADLKTTFRFLYPFVGGSAVSNSFNLADPDSGRIKWGGTVTHNANGITGDGASGTGDTGVTMLSNAVADWLVACGVYSRTASSGNWDELGNTPSAGASIGVGIMCRGPDGNMYAFNGPASGTTYVLVAVPNSQGLFVSLRSSATGINAFRNGVLLAGGAGTTVAATDDPMPSFVVLRGHPGRPPSSRNLAFAYVTNASTNASLGNLPKQAELYSYIQSFQVRLGRSI